MSGPIRSTQTGSTPVGMHSVQERYAPRSGCFGCGPANAEGLRIRSFEAPEGDGLVCDWQPRPIHEAFAGVLNGGIIGTLLDCHANWAATMALLRARDLDHVPATVTADLQLRFRRPARTDGPVHLRARATGIDGDRVTCEGELRAGEAGDVCATVRATFVAVGPGHPAYDRWDRPAGEASRSARPAGDGAEEAEQLPG
ncbi:MAG: PaaI family thioesterase [Candidatus Limnocylindrales bacterium]